jgi:hypothetical protein
VRANVDITETKGGGHEPPSGSLGSGGRPRQREGGTTLKKGVP